VCGGVQGEGERGERLRSARRAARWKGWRSIIRLFTALAGEGTLEAGTESARPPFIP